MGDSFVRRLCANGERCAYFGERGRPAYLTIEETRRSGICRRCEESSSKVRQPQNVVPSVAAISFDLSGEGGDRVTHDNDKNVANHETEHANMRGNNQKDEDSLDMLFFDRKTGKFVDKYVEIEEVVKDGSELSEDAFKRLLNKFYGDRGEFELRDADDNPAKEKADVIMRATSDEALALAMSADRMVIPSKNSPEPVLVEDISKTVDMVREGNYGKPTFNRIYSMAGFPGNLNKTKLGLSREGGPLKSPIFRYGMSLKIVNDHIWEGDEESSPLGQAATLVDSLGVAGISDESVEKIFKSSPEVVYAGLDSVTDMWNTERSRGTTPANVDTPYVTDGIVNYETSERIGSNLLPDNMPLAAQYAFAMEGFFYRRSFFNRWQEAMSDRNYHEYVADIIEKKGFKTEEEAVSYILSNPDEINNFLTDEKALDWIYDRSADITKEQYTTKVGLESIKKVLRGVNEFSKLIDDNWAARYEKMGVAALVERFGHPVGIPTDKLAPHHFLPGGYLVESGWVTVRDGDKPGLKVNFPVDADGRPSNSPIAWATLRPEIVLTRGASAVQRLGELAEACASASEAWQVVYNRGLPHDSLYNGALLATMPQLANGGSQDMESGTVRGLPHPLLRGININSGEQAVPFASITSKITAIARRFADDRTCPRGKMSLKEIDLANWRLTRLSDNLCGNEYGVNTVRGGVKKPLNFDKLGREYSENIQNDIRKGVDQQDGVKTFYQPEEDFVRPLVGRQRGEALRLFVEKPGTYLKRGGPVAPGPGLAVNKQITNPLTPTLAFTDPLYGTETDCSLVAETPPGFLSLFPYATLSQASGVMPLDFNPYLSGKENKSRSAKIKGIYYGKLMSVNPGSRSERLPKRVRFAARSLGENASGSGVLAIKNGDFKPVQNPNKYVAEPAIIVEGQMVGSSELSKAYWNDQAVYAKEHELGIMGSSWRGIVKNDDEAKKMLQGLLAGKYHELKRVTESTRQSVVLIQDFLEPVSGSILTGNRGAVMEDFIGYHDYVPRGLKTARVFDNWTHRPQYGFYDYGPSLYTDNKRVASHVHLDSMFGGVEPNDLEYITPLWDVGGKSKDRSKFFANWSQDLYKKRVGGMFVSDEILLNNKYQGETLRQRLDKKKRKLSNDEVATIHHDKFQTPLTFSPGFGGEAAIPSSSFYIDRDEEYLRALYDREVEASPKTPVLPRFEDPKYVDVLLDEASKKINKAKTLRRERKNENYF